MNLGNILVGVILVLICVAPFLILTKQNKKNKKSRLKSLNIEANNIECKIHIHEFCGNYLIGLDTEKNMLFFNKRLKEKTENISVNLSQVKECNICTHYQKVKNQKLKETKELYLSFSSTTKNKPEIKLTFFDIDIDMMLSGELESIKKWQNIINKQLAQIA